MVQSASLLSRKRDLLYFIFFAIHFPIIFRKLQTPSFRSFLHTTCSSVVDTVPLLPSILQTDLSHQLRSFYINTYHDKFFSEHPPAWFSTFIAMELLYHAPLSLWALGALLKAEVWAWDDRSIAQKWDLTMLGVYGVGYALEIAGQATG
ncbi:hypothetical protein BBP40_005255 [Aspergillus hancockii]|nr:hypothetical protein BBP40_005255 [Aspergillus hancockii]